MEKLRTILLKTKNIWGIPLFLSLFSIVEVFSASQYKAQELTGNPLYFALIHTAWILFGIFLAIVVFFLGEKTYKVITPIAYIVLIVTLILIFFAPAYNGAHRWLKLGNFTTFQPSELGKLILILFTAQFLSSKHKNLPETYSAYVKRYLKNFLLVIGIPLFLIVIEPDLSTTFLIGAVLYVMLLFNDKKYWTRNLFLGIGIGFFVLIAGIFAVKYRGDRLQTYLNLIKTGEVQDRFGKGYQISNILIGIGSGGLLGKGLGQSRQKEGYLLEATAFTDSIIAVILEELGFILGSLFISLYFYYYYSLTKIANSLESRYSQLIVWGAAHLILFQAIIHIAANLALIPLTGIALPFVTYGGTSMITFWMLVGILCRITVRPQRTTRPPRHYYTTS